MPGKAGFFVKKGSAETVRPYRITVQPTLTTVHPVFRPIASDGPTFPDEMGGLCPA